MSYGLYSVRVIYVRVGQGRYARRVDSSTTGMAPFERVAEAIRQSIREGRLAPGEKLPSNRKLAEQHDVSLVTAQKALGLLQDEGWLLSRASVGVYVSDTPPKDSSPRTLDEMRRDVTELRAAYAALERRVTRIEDRGK
jgi:GntR family transcriptional regulator